MIPVTYLVMRALTGFPPDYDLYSLAGGILPCFALFLSTRDIT